MSSWLGVMLVVAGCYAEKLVGVLVPPSLVTRRPSLERLASRLPAALLAALVVTNGVVAGHRLVVDARLAGIAAACVLLRLRAPLIAAVAGAALVTALVRLA